MKFSLVAPRSRFLSPANDVRNNLISLERSIRKRFPGCEVDPATVEFLVDEKHVYVMCGKREYNPRDRWGSFDSRDWEPVSNEISLALVAPTPFYGKGEAEKFVKADVVEVQEPTPGPIAGNITALLRAVKRFKETPLCAAVDPEIFFNPRVGTLKVAKNRKLSTRYEPHLDALKLCWQCPARQECREQTLKTEAHIPASEISGVAAGETADVRQARALIAEAEKNIVFFSKRLETGKDEDGRKLTPKQIKNAERMIEAEQAALPEYKRQYKQHFTEFNWYVAKKVIPKIGGHK